MTVVFESDARVVNATAGTSVVVSRPSGTVAGNVLYAVIAVASDTTISTPSGWTSLGTQAASTSVRASLFRRVCDGTEPASWTWTAGASVRNWGWVGRYSGVDPVTPEINTPVSSVDTTAGTGFATGNVAIHHTAPRTIAAVAAVRTASGAATTWTSLAETADERDDLSTNAGSGTDITGSVVDESFSVQGVYNNTFTASQSCSAGVTWLVSLTPLFAAYDGGQVAPIVEAAFGADPDDPDPDNWVWTDISEWVREDPGVTIGKGRADEQSQMGPTTISFSVLNDDGRFTPGHPTGAFYPHVRRRLPVRVAVPYGFAAPTELATAFVESITLGWDVSLRRPTADFSAVGRLAQIRQGDTLRSAMFRTITDVGGTSLPAPTAYWPLEDGSNATVFANERGGRTIAVDSNMRPASDSDLLGSAPLPTVATGGRGDAVLNAHAATGRFGVIFSMKMNSSPVENTVLFDVYCTGTIRQWRVYIAPGSPDQIVLALWDGRDLISSTANNLDEADFYGQWRMHALTAIENGSDVDWSRSYYRGSSGPGQLGTATNRTVGEVKHVIVANNAIFDGAVGHLAVYTDPDWEIATAASIAFAGMLGNSGERADVRFNRLMDEEGIPRETVVGESLILDMGPQPVADLSQLLTEIEDADQGVIHDGGASGAIVFVPRDVRYNRAVDLSLDMDSGHIAPGWSPVYDTQRLRTQSTVSRTAGSSATYIGDQAEGRNKDTLTVNHDNDSNLLNVASWRVAVGSTPGMRYPKVEVDLRRNPDLAEQILAMRVGQSRLTGTGLPSEHGPVDLDGFVEGYSIQLSNFTWKWQANLSPAAPYDVGIWEDDVRGRADTAGSELGSGINSSATSLSVATTAGPIWITTATHGSQFPFDIKIGGEVMTVTAISGASSPQTFTVTRSVNGVVKSHAAGDEVRLANPMIAAL